MTVLGIALSLPLIALGLAVSVLPVWFAAKVVGAGRSEFLRVAAALVVATLLTWMLVVISVGWGVLLMPVVFILTFSKMLDTSWLGAFVLCILALAFQVGLSKLISALAGA